MNKNGRVLGCKGLTVLNDGVSLHALNGVACLPQSSEAMALASPEPDTHVPTVMLDAWFNSQQRKNAAGHTEYFHYKWNDVSDSGFSLLGQSFKATESPSTPYTPLRLSRT